MTTKHHIR